VRELELVQSVGVEDLQRVAEQYFSDHNLTVGWFIPENGAT
jgi:predicted Zn-dependent peptidase